jgi:hypothetical protein
VDKSVEGIRKGNHNILELKSVSFVRIVSFCRAV